jgi:hypothetical protein
MTLSMSSEGNDSMGCRWLRESHAVRTAAPLRTDRVLLSQFLRTWKRRMWYASLKRLDTQSHRIRLYLSMTEMKVSLEGSLGVTLNGSFIVRYQAFREN